MFTRKTHLFESLITRVFSLSRISFSKVSSSNIIKINDFDSKSSHIREDEKTLRCKLASVYRLVYLNNWTSGIFNHISARVNNKDESDNYLINPFGLLYYEITASNLVKINENCDIIDKGTSSLGVNKAGFTLHSTIHTARPDINFIIHVHTKTAAAVSTLKCGFLPISQEAMICGNVSYHDYGGILIEEEMKKKIEQDLGPENKIMILRNHGVVVCGSTIEEAWHYLYNFMYACDILLNAVQSARDIQSELHIPNIEIRKKVKNLTKHGGGGVNVTKNEVDWRLGELEFEAEMRRLDFLGYNTGYKYKLNMK